MTLEATRKKRLSPTQETTFFGDFLENCQDDKVRDKE